MTAYAIGYIITLVFLLYYLRGEFPEFETDGKAWVCRVAGWAVVCAVVAVISLAWPILLGIFLFRLHRKWRGKRCGKP